MSSTPRSHGTEPVTPVAADPRQALVFDDPLSRPSSDDTDEGWGERPEATEGTSDLARFLEEKPPHHL